MRALTNHEAHDKAALADDLAEVAVALRESGQRRGSSELAGRRLELHAPVQAVGDLEVGLQRQQCLATDASQSCAIAGPGQRHVGRVEISVGDR